MAKLDTITQDYINNKYKYDKYIYPKEVRNDCINIDTFIITNLLNILNKLLWFVYINPSNFTKNDINMLFHINKSRKILTLSLDNEQDHIKYEYIPYAKKYVSCLILKSEIDKFVNYIEYYNDGFNDDGTSKPYISILFDDQIKLLDKKILETNDEHNDENQKYSSNKYSSYVLSYDNEYNPVLTLHYFNYLFSEGFNSLDANTQNELKEHYVGVLIYENEINTKTDIIKIIHKFC